MVNRKEQVEKILPLEMDLLNQTSVSDVVKQTFDAFGKIKTVVNNADYGQVRTLEELADREIRQNFEVNVFGVLNVIRRVMPHFRARLSTSVHRRLHGKFCPLKRLLRDEFAVAALIESLVFRLKITLKGPSFSALTD